MNPYHKLVSGFARLFADGKQLPPGRIPPHDKPKSTPDKKSPVALIFSPHPDDECIIGGLPLRLLRENKTRVVNVAVTLGSNKERRQKRLRELKNACNWIGFELEHVTPDGLEKINVQTRKKKPAIWNRSVKMVSALLLKFRPQIIFSPHAADGHGTHIGAHFLVMDALKLLPKNFQTVLVETEFWAQMPSPNLIVESSADDVADLIAALSFHVGEMKRNPYHLRLPAWLQDNVRRGAEMVGGQGSAAPDFLFATLYRARRWKNGRVGNLFFNGKRISAKENPSAVFNFQK